MSLKRVGVLLKKDLLRGPKNFVFIFAIVGPILISFVMTLIFGNLFSEKPQLGVFDEGDSQLVSMFTELSSIDSREYTSASVLKNNVETGALDMGVILPSDFDNAIIEGQSMEITAYVWGESLAKDRAIAGAVIAEQIRELAGQNIPVVITTTTLGDSTAIPWNDRLLPLIVIIAVIMGGSMVPATSLVDEKQKLTLRALVITPATLEEVFIAKGLVGVILSIFMGVFILVLNQAFGTQPLLLVGVLAMGAVLAAGFGVLLGAFMKDITTLFATLKGIGILLYAPAIIYMFPQLPQWIARIFPTYYIFGPIIEITQKSGTWSDIIMDVSILAGLIVILLIVLAGVTRRLKQREA